MTPATARDSPLAAMIGTLADGHAVDRDRLRLELVRAAQDKGATWASVAAVLGYPSGKQAKKAIHALGKRVQAAEQLGSRP